MRRTGLEWATKKLTYDATSIKCALAVRAGLVLRPPRRERLELKRRMYLTPDISAALDGRPTSTYFAHGPADAKITDFLRGARIDVSREKRSWKGPKPDLVKVVGHDEVWEFCFRAPKPGWRLFGRFLDRTVFVGLQLRDKLDTGNDYDPIAVDVLRDWARLFPDVEPVRSEEIDDYVGFVWRDLDGQD